MIKEFGVLPDGTVVQEITLAKGPLAASILTLGGITVSYTHLTLPTKA